MSSVLRSRPWHSDLLNLKQPALSANNGETREWQPFIDTLSRWQSHPEGIEDLGIEPSSAEVLTRALHIAKTMRDGGLHAPMSVVPDPNGGIVFTYQEQGISEEIHVWDDGVIEYMCFDGQRLTERRKIA